MESNHSTRKAIVAAMQCFQRGDLKNDEIFGWAPVLEGPLDEGMAYLCGSETDREIGSGDGVELGDARRWARTIGFSGH